MYLLLLRMLARELASIPGEGAFNRKVMAGLPAAAVAPQPPHLLPLRIHQAEPLVQSRR